MLLTKYYYIRSCYEQLINTLKLLCHTDDYQIPTLQG